MMGAAKKRFSLKLPAWAVNSWTYTRPVALLVCGVLVVGSFFAVAGGKVYGSMVSPPDPSDKTPYLFSVASRSSVATISENLQKEGFIRNAKVFKYYVDFTDRATQFRAGDYLLAKCMTLEEIIETLTLPAAPAKQVKIQLTEGFTVAQMAERFVEEGLLPNADEFLTICKNGLRADGEPWSADYAILRDRERAGETVFLLEGYLAPDTYLFFENSTPYSLLTKLLQQTEMLLGNPENDLQGKAETWGYNMDELVTLASIVQAEAGRGEDFAKVSAVFYNRLKAGMALQSDATVSYITGSRSLNLTQDDLSTDSPYNTYQHKGLPPGPVCNPSLAALQAAATPYQEYIDQNYLYFCTGDPANNELVFARTLAEHNANVAKYRPLWEAWDQNSAG